jgi:serine/threonine protein kinase/formylglycine-generating enzyme required for sulfatase activity
MPPPAERDPRFARLRELFDEARQQPAADREAFVQREAGADTALRDELLGLLRAHSAPTQVFADLARESLARAAHPESIGPYRIVDVLGEGGMGTVYLAEQREPVRRQVAVKVIKLGMDSKAVLARFAQERQALAVMNHAHIAHVFDAGTSERGQPYFVMEYVPGVPLTEYCDRERLSLEDRIALFQQVCAGVQHAHQKGVIHRDLKPSNVLVGEEQGQPAPKIIDFGLARATEPAQASVFTQQGQIVGTLEYMSPEQADPTDLDIDTRTDVYALGVMLFELLVGTVPFARADPGHAGLLDLQRRIRDEEPPRPSTRLTAAAAARRRTTPSALLRTLRDDLDWIVLAAIDKDRNRRYGSAADLAADLGRHLAHEPVTVGPPSTGYRLRKLLRRHRGRVVAGAALLAVLVAGIVGTTLGLLRANAQAARADAKIEEFNQLAGMVLCDLTLAAENELYPPWPEKIAAMERWLHDDCGKLLAMRPQIERTVANLRARGTRAAATARWTFAGDDERFLHDTLEELLGRLAALENNQMPGVERRLRWARAIEEMSIARHRQRWDAARAAIAASERYRAQPIDLRPQLGLVPIGENPQTGLWEFYELRSAWDGESDPASLPIPTHRADGSIEVTGETGIVFVLLPGGTFTMGAQKNDPNGPNYDEHAEAEERLFEVTLAPFLLARHEMTQGQWQRLTGSNPSGYAPGSVWAGTTVTRAHPVEHVSWEDCNLWLPRYGLTLPTEAQWEYACRAGTTTPWSCAFDELRNHANLPDESARTVSPNWPNFEKWTDGHAVHAPVGSFLANDFGMHDVHGNVREATRDSASPEVPPRPGDGAREPAGSKLRANRGGDFFLPARYSRSASRDAGLPSTRRNNLGVRAMRLIVE